MKKLILISILIIAIYLVVRQNLIGDEPPMPEKGLENYTTEEKVKALDELKVFYPKTPVKRPTEAPKPLPKVERAFYEGSKEDYERLEKIQYLDERGNPVNLDEEGEP